MAHLRAHEPLGEPHEDGEKIRDALAGERGQRDDADVLLEVLYAPVEVGREAGVRQLTDDLVEVFIEHRLRTLGLCRHALLDRFAVLGVPPRRRVDFVRRDDKGGAGPAQDVYCLLGLGLEAVVDVDDEHRDVGERAAAGPQRREGVVAGRIDEQQAGQVEVRRVNEIAGHPGDRVERDVRRPDVLGDRAGLALADGGAADRVEQAGFAVIDVAQHGDDRRPKGVRVCVVGHQ